MRIKLLNLTDWFANKGLQSTAEPHRFYSDYGLKHISELQAGEAMQWGGNPGKSASFTGYLTEALVRWFL